jgi:hypothetical protein
MTAYHVERPENRKEHHWTPEEARGFLSSWCRVVAADGSTVAYAPDVVSAEAIAEGLDAWGAGVSR